MQGIINGFNEVIGALKALVEGTMMLIKWIPQSLAFASNAGIVSAIPALFLPCATVILVIYLIKVVLGGDNGS